MNQPLVFLFGAGASAPAGIPISADFVQRFARALGARGRDTELLSACLKEIVGAWDQHHTLPLDLERLYEILDHINGTDQQFALELPTDFPKWSRATDLIGWELKRYVQRCCLDIAAPSLEYLAPLLKFHSTDNRLAILTLNYDTAVEQICNAYGVRWTDGFAADGGELVFDRYPAALELVKLHGSASWYWVGEEIRRLIGRTQASIGRKVGTARTMTHEAIMVYPTLAKPLWSWPFPQLILEARKLLQGASACVACGYAFRDKHIRNLVVGILRSNPRLRLAIVDPRADSVLETVLRAAQGTIDERRFHLFSGEAGKVQNALKSEELDSLVYEWTRGGAGRAPTTSSPPAKRLRLGAANMTVAVDTAATGIAVVDDRVVFAVPAAGELRCFHPGTRQTDRLVDGLSHPRGLAYDSSSGRLFVIENRYRIARGELPIPTLPHLDGVGRLWSFDTTTSLLAPVTRLDLITSSAAAARKVRANEIDSEALFGELRGVLRWPTSVAVEVPGQRLLVTQAKSLTRVMASGGFHDNVLQIALIFNLVGVALVDARVVLVDAGVYPNGSGRVLIQSPGENEAIVVRDGLRLVGSVAAIGANGYFAISHGGWWPDGTVELCHVSNPARALQAWTRLDVPSHIALSPSGDSLFVTTAAGIGQLSLAGIAIDR